MVTNFFLGANSSAGFRSLYENFTAPEGNFDILVLKGGPGVGKSSFMKYIGSRAEEAGEDVEYIWCSGDPDSLDAVRLPRVGVIAVDGTSPHVVEPQYPAAVDRYVNLGQFYHIETCKQRREEILRHTTTFGVRRTDCPRYAMQVASETVETAYGPIRLKCADGAGIHKEKPEYGDVARCAQASGLSFQQVWESALTAGKEARHENL